MLCQYCSCSFSSSFKLLRHQQLRHSFYRNRFLCVYDKCPSSFSKLGSLKQHLIKHNRPLNEKLIGVHVTGELNNEENVMDTSHSDVFQDQSSECCDFIDEVNDSENVYEKLCSSVAFFFLQARDKYLLPSSTVKDLTSGLINILCENHNTLLYKMKNYFQNRNMNDLLVEFMELNDMNYVTTKHLEHFMSDNKILEVLSSHFNYVAPSECILSPNKVFHYISIRQSLLALLQNEEIRSQCFNKSTMESPFFQSPYFKDCLKGLASHAIYLALYSDDFSLNNPIGAVKNKQKILGVYFKILNLKSSLLSQVNQHHLVLLCNREYIKEYGMHRVFQPLIEELNDMFYRNLQIDCKTSLPVIAAFMSGDNLSQHLLLGMSVSFSHNFICRFCHINISEITNTMAHSEFIFRSDISFSSYAKSSTFNVKEASVFEKLSYVSLPLFFPPDIMHDMLEGVTHTVICFVLLDILKNDFLHLEEINSQMKLYLSFSPTSITLQHLKNYKLSMFTASQMLEVALLLPFMVGAYVPVNWKTWHILLMHCEVINNVFAINNTSYNMDHVHYLIQQHISILLESIGERIKSKCKIHYLSHYHYFVNIYGSLQLLWSMRFESLHQILKQLMRKTKQLKNPTYSMAHRFQSKICLEISSHMYGKFPTYCKHLIPFSLNELDPLELDCVKGVICSDEFFCEAAAVLSHENRMYCTRLAMVIIMNINYDEDDPVFAQVKYILFIKAKWYLLCHIYVSKWFSHFNAFRLCSVSKPVCVVPGQELFHPLLKIHILNGEKYVVLQHCVS